MGCSSDSTNRVIGKSVARDMHRYDGDCSCMDPLRADCMLCGRSRPRRTDRGRERRKSLRFGACPHCSLCSLLRRRLLFLLGQSSVFARRLFTRRSRSSVLGAALPPLWMMLERSPWIWQDSARCARSDSGICGTFNLIDSCRAFVSWRRDWLVVTR